MPVTQEIKSEKQLPKGWHYAKLGETINIIRGISFPKDAKRSNYEKGLIACLRTTNVQKQIEWEDLWFVDRKYLKRDEQLIRINDIVISTANSLELLGKSALVRTIPYESTLGTFITNLRTPNGVNAKYIYYYLCSRDFLDNVRNNGSTTTNISNISVGKLEKIEIKLAPLPEQHRIVQKIEELFSELDNAITTLKTTQQQLNTYRQSVLKHAFEGKLTEVWRGNIIRVASALKKRNSRIEPIGNEDISQLPKLPKNWEWVKIGQILDVFVGSTPSRKVNEYWEGTINWVSSGEVRNNYINATKEKITELGLENSATKIHPPGTVLIAMIGEGKTRGQAAILKISAAHNQNTAAIRLDKEVYLSKILYYYFIYTYEKNRNTGSGNNQKALNKNIIENISIPFCVLEEQQQIVNEIETRLSESDYLLQTINNQLTHAESLRQSILQRAFSGEL